MSADFPFHSIFTLPPQIVTVNCARLIKPDQHATNGIVHVVDRVITAISNNVNMLIDVDDDLETLRVSISVNQSMRVRLEGFQMLTSCVCILGGDGRCRSDLHFGERGSVHHLRSHQRGFREDSSGDPEPDPGRPCGSKR